MLHACRMPPVPMRERVGERGREGERKGGRRDGWMEGGRVGGREEVLEGGAGGREGG